MEKLPKLKRSFERKQTQKQKRKIIAHNAKKAGGSHTTGQFFYSKVKILKNARLLILKSKKEIPNSYYLKENIDYKFDDSHKPVLSPLQKKLHAKFRHVQTSTFKEIIRAYTENELELVTESFDSPILDWQLTLLYNYGKSKKNYYSTKEKDSIIKLTSVYKNTDSIAVFVSHNGKPFSFCLYYNKVYHGFRFSNKNIEYRGPQMPLEIQDVLARVLNLKVVINENTFSNLDILL